MLLFIYSSLSWLSLLLATHGHFNILSEIVKSDMATWRKQSSQNTQALGDVHDQPRTNMSTSELTQIKNRIDELELISEAYGISLTHLEANTNYLHDRMENNTNEKGAMESSQLAESISLKLRMTAIEDSTEMLKVLTNKLSNESQIGLSQIMTRTNTLESTVQELELNTTFYLAQIENRIINIEFTTETNLTKAKNNDSDRITNLEAYMTKGNEHDVQNAPFKYK